MHPALTYTPPQWHTTSNPPVPLGRFGKDHWATFAYVETRIVDYKGLLEHDQMRTDATRHMGMQAAKRRTSMIAPEFRGDKYPTRIKGKLREVGGFEMVDLPDHDDYDCIDDLVAAGLLEIRMPRQAKTNKNLYEDANGKLVTPDRIGGMDVPSPTYTTGMGEQSLMAVAVFALTEKGRKVAGELRAWKGGGGNFHQFVPAIAGA